MITRLSHTSIYVNDQEKAYEFYVNTLGFKVKNDTKMGNGFRWLTLNPPEQPDLEIILMDILHESMQQSPDFDEETQKAFKLLMDKGILGAGVFNTPDCRATYEELKAKGVKFAGEPKEQFYGIEAVMYDGCGNWFSLTQPKQM
jgi:catechol 2,3-dioxygenase-like lactoylglutathione lyase family enzyme